MKAIADNVVAALSRRVESSPWMTDGSKATAAAKLKTLYFGVAYPDRWHSDADLVIDSADAVGNLRRIADRQYRRALSRLASVGSTGSPLSPEGFDWVASELGRDAWLFSTSGGTDVCTAFVGGVPTLPVYRGELQARSLGAKVEAWRADGTSVVNEVGELVIAEPMPSMPTGLWNDPDGSRYRASYFDTFPGVWRHGDWITILPSGACVISGRSDSTLNRGGVRIGTSELYRVVEAIPGVVDALVVDTGGPDEEGEIVLFVVLEGVELGDELRGVIASNLRSQLSPRHVPDRIVEAPGVPMTLNGKRLEVPVKRLLAGEPADRVASPESLRDPAIFRWYAEHAASMRGGDERRR